MTKKWEWEIKAQTSWLGMSFKEFLKYRDLLLSLVRKEYLSSYQQTLLGPAWVLLQPVLTVVIYVLVFKEVMGFSTEGKPAIVYYMVGITLWNFFSELFTNVSHTFIYNSAIYEKVYFPRLISPISMVILNLIRLSIQLALLLAVILYFYATDQLDIEPLRLLVIFPVIIIVTGIAMGGGLIFSLISVKYKDLLGLLQLLLRLMMFVCPIFFSTAMVPKKLSWLVELNPLSPLFELFRFAFLGIGHFSMASIIYSTAFMVILLFSGLAFFNKTNERLIDVA
jgi:lipopolysaccharide transport system permease protein